MTMTNHTHTPDDRLRAETEARSLEGLRDAAVLNLRAHLRTPAPEALRAVAEALVEARVSHFKRADGEPDLAGRSYAYRVWVGRDVYDAAGLRKADRHRIGSGIRYHLTVVLRDRFPYSTLERYGLDAGDGATKARERRAERSEREAALEAEVESLCAEVARLRAEVERLERREG